MEKPVIFMLSGHGTQFFGMGKELFEQHPVFRNWITSLDKIIKDNINFSIIDILYDTTRRKSDIFDNTLQTNLSLFIVEYSLARTLMESGINPDYLLGYSLGEIIAISLSGILSIEETITGLIKQAELMEKNCPAGGMLAVLENPDLYNKTSLINKNSELISISFDSHFVISGYKNKLLEIQEFLNTKNILYQMLPVSHAFHSSLLDPIAVKFKDYLLSATYNKSKIPIISCVNAEVILEISKEHLWRVIREPIFFRKTIQRLENDSVYKNSGYTYIDLSPSGTLSTFLKNILVNSSESEIYSIMSPFGNDSHNLEKVLKLMFGREKSPYKKEVKKMTTYVFPGQGSQKKGMGIGLFDEFREQTAKADDILGYSIEELCLQDPMNQLGQTQFTQPALYVVNSLIYLKKIQETGTKPDYVAGHSLGEYCALFAAGVYSFETGIRLVKKRGELMSKVSGGGMAAVIGLKEAAINKVLNDNGLDSITIANYNSPTQIVISGIKEDIIKAQQIFEKAGAQLYVPLNVSGAFHSPHMAAARKEFEQFLTSVAISELVIPVISNVYARPYKQTDIKKNLVEQITNPVKWTETIQYLMGMGEMNFEELGPGKVLTGLIKRIKNEAQPLIFSEDEDLSAEGEKRNLKQAKGDGNIKVQEEVNNIERFDNVNKKGFNDIKPDHISITAESLGCKEYKKEYNVTYAYVTGGMYRGIASKEMVVKMGRAGMMGYLGTGGLGLDQIEESIKYIQNELKNGEAYGMNLLSFFIEDQVVELYLKNHIKNIEAAAYIQVTPALVRYRLKGLYRDSDDNICSNHKIMAKLSRPEVAEEFLSPAPERLINKLLDEKKITGEEAELSKHIAMADDICVEADSGGHSDGGVAYALMPAMLRLRDDMMKKYNYTKRIRVGAAGGIGTPEAAAAAFILGADFILTGSINQCTVEAGTSDAVKNLLQDINVQDTAYAPAGDMFESGARVQVLKKGVFFPMRANKLYDLYRQYNSLEEIDDKTKKQIQEKYFKRSFDDIFEEVKNYYPALDIENAAKSEKSKMSIIFRWYFDYSTDLALKGKVENIVDFQVMCGPALGAFNQWVKGTKLESWRNRHVDQIGLKIMHATAEVLNRRFFSLSK